MAISLLRSEQGEGVAVTAGFAERIVFRSLAGVVHGVTDVGDPAFMRLFPDAHGDADDAREFRELTEAEVRSLRSGDAAVVESSLARMEASLADDRADDAADGSTTLTFPEAESWVRLVGTARIVLAARLGLFEGGNLGDVTDDSHNLVQFLSYVQDELVEALLSNMAGDQE